MSSTVSASTSKPGPPPVVIPAASGNNIVISSTQKGNPVLEAIRNVGKEFGDILADYQVGRTTGVLYLSLKYHRLHPDYIAARIEKLGHSYTLRILLILCDVTEHRDLIRDLTRLCLINNVTIITAFSLDEAGHYLATYKQFEYRSPDLIKERTEKDYNSLLRASLTSIPKVNKTDVETLRTSFGSFAGISRATTDQLQNLPGFGRVKVKNVKTAFDKPFKGKPQSTLAVVSSSQLPSFPQTSTSSASATSKGASMAKQSRAQPSTTATSSSSALNPNEGASTLTTQASGRRPRSPSPDWDIELDLDLPDDDFIPHAPPRPPPNAGEVTADISDIPTGEFDIDLDP
ncbi:DNA repair protein rad10 [Coprinopsis marcescibilis]|uniref:DNA repair protein rad10 n=1 Tax=Coprinopsis marcescibilis TaxID=230819 RepID=A0A5C3KZE6_COPMA|nr:DNA repair protein rad10 [Coprinopsis marcescibilis]